MTFQTDSFGLFTVLRHKLKLCVIFFVFFLTNSFAVAQNTGAQNAQTQKSNFQLEAKQNQKSSFSLLIGAVFENPTDLEVNFKLLEEQTRVGDLRGAGICTIADSVSSYTCTGSGQCTEDNHASVDTSVNASFKLLQNASTDQAAVGGIDIFSGR